ncbi:hypothetical protein [Sinomonas sp. P10A9]|uniref:Uncharacterized protein n=1 Tax=Sinomonas puerhi TaxID=3238584 RepID=A0AB39L798_9MICC
MSWTTSTTALPLHSPLCFADFGPTGGLLAILQFIGGLVASSVETPSFEQLGED